jgi:hypothetical protein
VSPPKSRVRSGSSGAGCSRNGSSNRREPPSRTDRGFGRPLPSRPQHTGLHPGEDEPHPSIHPNNAMRAHPSAVDSDRMPAKKRAARGRERPHGQSGRAKLLLGSLPDQCDLYGAIHELDRCAHRGAGTTLTPITASSTARGHHPANRSSTPIIPDSLALDAGVRAQVKTGGDDLRSRRPARGESRSRGADHLILAPRPPCQRQAVVLDRSSGAPGTRTGIERAQARSDHTLYQRPRPSLLYLRLAKRISSGCGDGRPTFHRGRPTGHRGRVNDTRSKGGRHD